MQLQEKVLKAHDRQVRLASILAKVGNTSPIGRFLRLIVYYLEAAVMLRNWRNFLYIRKDNIGEKFFAVDQAVIHTSFSEVKKLMQTQPQLRGNDLGIIRILAPSYLLNNPLSLGMNGQEHQGARALFSEALPDPLEVSELLGELVNQNLADAAKKGELHIGNDLPEMLIRILHRLVFEITLTEEEVKASKGFVNDIAIASLPNFVVKYLLAFRTAPTIKHRQHLIERYKQSPRWAALLETGSKYQLNEHQIGNTLFDMIHIAGTAGTSALLGSVIGVLTLKEDIRNHVISEVNTIWNNQETFNKYSLENATLTEKVILETARLYPPVRFVSQLATQAGEITVKETKCPFQKGTRLIGSVFTANRDTNRYENPDSFDITRDFSDNLSWNSHGHERICPGRSLSIGIIKTFCLHLLQKYQWQSSTEAKWDFDNVTAVTPNDLVLQEFTQKP
ncbi:cytochrome [Nostoc sp. CENA543]|uniref:cytochrome P450 n=1 Tax=Nostoc sp. CENA543 TaxID=1869241 RepID=UPI000CA39E20|nr:cytochrome P450 [Nostoc sp. CENA543]AUT03066.1 cytochrome [Nostoc sp. CENA543]